MYVEVVQFVLGCYVFVERWVFGSERGVGDDLGGLFCVELLLCGAAVGGVCGIAVVMCTVVFVVKCLNKFGCVGVMLGRCVRCDSCVVCTLVFFLSVNVFCPFLERKFGAFSGRVLGRVDAMFLVVTFLSMLVRILLKRKRRGTLSTDIVVGVVVFSPMVRRLFGEYTIVAVLGAVLGTSGIICVLVDTIVFTVFRVGDLGRDKFVPRVDGLLVCFVLKVKYTCMCLHAGGVMSTVMLRVF